MRRFATADELSLEEALAAPVRYPRPSQLREALPEVRPQKSAKALERMGIATKGDLLSHAPFRYEERRDALAIGSLVPGEDVTVIGEVRRISKRAARRRRMTLVEATVFDESGVLQAVWFNQPWVVDKLPAGTRVLLHGRYDDRNRLRVTEYEEAGGASAAELHSTGTVPVYPASEGIAAVKVRELAQALEGLERHALEPLPGRMRALQRMPDRAAALAAVHFPSDESEPDAGRHRLAFEELVLLELAFASRRRARRELGRARPLEATGELVAPWQASLPFEPTGDQLAAFEEIDRDLGSTTPMQRLLMGEVGSGKTVVALRAMLRAVESGRQALLMAPTETLAEQHMATLDRLLGGLVPIALLTGSTPAKRRREIHDRLASGELGLVVGTHALLEPGVQFRDLALYVIDEQHRFGVRQRATLDGKAPEGLTPHALHMTATPIPRTLALTAYGDLDTTTLRELPAGRRPIETHVVDGARARARAYERIREEIAKGRQCFVVCPLVEESEALQATAATEEAKRLQAGEFRDHRVELIHGQMPTARKQEAMAKFAAGEADVLVATSVIEVGIDVPNATVMLIEAAERYGISQLHQLRGRIGRGEHESLCILFGDPTLPRLEAVAKERDGFKLAEVDLAIRGAGELLGTRQHGLPEFRVARLPEDVELLQRAREIVDELLDADPGLEQPEHVLLREAAAERFGPELDPIPA